MIKEYRLHWDGALIHAALQGVVDPQLKSGEIGPPEVLMTIAMSRKLSGLSEGQVMRAFRKMIQCWMIKPMDYTFKVGYSVNWEQVSRRLRELFEGMGNAPYGGTIKPKPIYWGPLPNNMDWEWTEWGFYAYIAIKELFMGGVDVRERRHREWLAEDEAINILAPVCGSPEQAGIVIKDLISCGILIVRSR